MGRVRALSSGQAPGQALWSHGNSILPTAAPAPVQGQTSTGNEGPWPEMVCLRMSGPSVKTPPGSETSPKPLSSGSSWISNGQKNNASGAKK